MDTTGWLKGNTHTHTTRSDGDATVRRAARWYADRSYDFLVITDHNRYLRPRQIEALAPIPVRPARAASGSSRVRGDNTTALPHALILIPGTELSYKSELTGRPIDVCSLGGQGADPPSRRVVFVGGDAAATVRAAVGEARSAGGLPVVCHPCWRWALSADDLLTLPGRFCLELFNPSSNCNTYGAGGVDSPEDIWSKLLTAGRRVWAVAADDAHRLVEPGAPPRDGGGIGWVRVGAKGRSAGAILSALRAGRFYASTGVELAELTAGPRQFALRVAPAGDRRYTIRLLGPGGRELRVVHDTQVSYRPGGRVGFVRARVDDTEGARCWTQPWFVGDGGKARSGR